MSRRREPPFDGGVANDRNEIAPPHRSSLRRRHSNTSPNGNVLCITSKVARPCPSWSTREKLVVSKSRSAKRATSGLVHCGPDRQTTSSSVCRHRFDLQVFYARTVGDKKVPKLAKTVVNSDARNCRVRGIRAQQCAVHESSRTCSRAPRQRPSSKSKQEALAPITEEAGSTAGGEPSSRGDR
jgi:hypothetical protein